MMRDLGWMVGLGFIGLMTAMAVKDVGKFVPGITVDATLVLAVLVITGFPFLCGLAAGRKR